MRSSEGKLEFSPQIRLFTTCSSPAAVPVSVSATSGLLTELLEDKPYFSPQIRRCWSQAAMPVSVSVALGWVLSEEINMEDEMGLSEMTGGLSGTVEILCPR